LLYLSPPFFPAVNKVEIITGHLKPCCANVVTVFPADAGDPGKAGLSNLAFLAHFAAPFQYAMQSENGALRLVNAPAAAPRDQIEAAYGVLIQLTRGGAWGQRIHQAEHYQSIDRSNNSRERQAVTFRDKCAIHLRILGRII
jgi:hypothetical protein